jgi:hypothetical protein
VDRCALFVDAGYVLGDGAMAVHGAGHRDSVTWDFAGLLQFLSGVAADRTGLPMLRCYWYEATVDGRRSPEHDTLADLPGLMLRLGRMRPGKREGVETEIHRDLTTLARNHAIADVVLVSAEEDLAQVIADVQDLGVRVIIVHISVDGNWTVSRVLRQQCDDIVELNGAQLRPFAQLAAAEPARYSEPYANGSYARPMSNGHGAGLAGTGNHPALPAGLAGLHPAPPAIYTAPVVAEYQPPSYPPVDGQPLMPQPPAAYPAADGQPPVAQPRQAEPAPAMDQPPAEQGPRGLHENHAGEAQSQHGRSSPPLYAAPPPASFRDLPPQDLPGGPGQAPASPSLPGRRAAPQPGYEPAAFADAPGSQFSPAPPEQFSAAPDQFGPATPGAAHRAQQSLSPSNGTSTRAPLPSRTSQGSRSQPQPAPVPNGSYVPPQSSYSPALPVPSAGAPSAPLGDTVQAAHAEGFELGESVAREAPALWLEAVLARKPRMPSDLEARLLQGSALPIDSLLHDEVRHALRSGFWDALERSRR